MLIRHGNYPKEKLKIILFKPFPKDGKENANLIFRGSEYVSHAWLIQN